MIKILIVDDEPSIANILKKQLESLKYAVVTANNGMEALEKVKSYHPDLMILDVMMPKMDGYRVLEELQKQGEKEQHIPVIVLTARKAMRDIFSGMQQVRHFVEKPFDPNDMVSKIEEIASDLKKQKTKIVRSLIIGMDWEIVRPMRTLMEAREVIVFTATDASKAVEEAVKHTPDMIFCASLIPGMEVSSLCKLFRDMPSTKAIPIIVYDSAGHLNAEQAESIDANMIIDYKRHEDLISKVDEYLKEYFYQH